MTDEDYGSLVFQDREIVAIGDVPQWMLIPLDLLVNSIKRGVHVMEGGTVAFGRHEDGGHVWYKVVDWDPVREALILELDTVMREVGKK